MTSGPQTIYKKVRSGDSLTDEELTEGIKFFKDLSDNLFKVGPEFLLPADAAWGVYLKLKSFQNARNNKW